MNHLIAGLCVLPSLCLASLFDEGALFNANTTGSKAACPTDGSKDCSKAKCCATAGDKCYQKNTWWASCKASCTPGIDPADPPKYQQPWTCKVLGEGPPAGDCPADGSEDCTAAKCCADPGMKCYKKSNYWASCKESCTPGVDPNDPPEYQDPWDCTVLSEGGGGGGGGGPAPSPSPRPSPRPSSRRLKGSSPAPSTPVTAGKKQCGSDELKVLYACDPEDKPGSVCGNDGEPTEAYCTKISSGLECVHCPEGSPPAPAKSKSRRRAASKSRRRTKKGSSKSSRRRRRKKISSKA